MERKRLIKITKNTIYLTPEMRLNLSQTNLSGSNFSFSSYKDIYLEIEILAYDKNLHTITVEIVDYQPKDNSSFRDQTAKAQVSFIEFKPLNWQLIEKYLSSYTKSELLRNNIVFDDEQIAKEDTPENLYSRRLIVNEEKLTEYSRPTYSEFRLNYIEPAQRVPFVEKISEYAKIYFKDVDFNLGYVAFSFKSKKLNEIFNLKIENHFLLPEFNAIKSYFSKVFDGKKQFSIIINFTRIDKVVTDIVTTSPEIASINQNIIDSIKRERVAKLTSTPLRDSVDQSLFTAEDIFDSFEDDLKDGNVFKQSEEDILNFLIETRNIRNAKHLQFLSGSKHSIKQKLRFTLRPNFGFVFFIEGETKNHFCWELLNSHATYLWSFDKIETDSKFQFKRIEETINIIRDMGREAYKNSFKNNTIDDDLDFCTIEHSNINSPFKDGFVDWHHRLNERLV